jgi:hypothetical protein
MLVAVVGLALALKPPDPAAAGPSGHPVSASADTASPPPPAWALAHFDRDGLAFDYPAAWSTSAPEVDMHYVTILAFLGTGSGRAECASASAGQGDQIVGSTMCRYDLTGDPGQVMDQLWLEDGPFEHGPIDPSDPSGVTQGGNYTEVGGLPAIYSEDSQRGADSTATLYWTLSVPSSVMERYLIKVEIEGPGLEQMRAQVQALVASIRYSPPAPVLITSNGPRMVSMGLDQATAKDPALACFPRLAGTTATATITVAPGQTQLGKPLPVTCRTDIEPFAMWLWRLTLTESWTAASDRSAGSLTTTVWLSADGVPQSTTYLPSDPSKIPYAE